MSFLYFVELLAVVYFTRPSLRRIFGALAGGGIVGVFGLGIIFLGNAFGLWQVSISWTPIFLSLFYLGLAISVSPIYLVTWRIARRFGLGGLAVFIGLATLIGPPRDYVFAATFPEWMVFAPGVAPVVADAAAYFGIVAIGHAVMRLISGPSRGDLLARHRRLAAR